MLMEKLHTCCIRLDWSHLEWIPGKANIKEGPFNPVTRTPMKGTTEETDHDYFEHELY